MSLHDLVQNHLHSSARIKEAIIDSCSDTIVRAIETMHQQLAEGRKLLICGNGGSAADAQHMAAEFVIRLSHDLQRPAIPAMALTTDTSILTAGGNDIGFKRVFARQVEAFGQKGDILMVISTSGNSENLLLAVQQAKQRQMVTIGLLGNQGGKLDQQLDISIIVPSNNTQHIQEGHITIGHI
ncbi:MAG: SIS domain-containing protein, partial [Caldithrix sp.]|nr:SIS domain-containing protein [Caldithrix sp.]